jgi:hypothetical protein
MLQIHAPFHGLVCANLGPMIVTQVIVHLWKLQVLLELKFGVNYHAVPLQVLHAIMELHVHLVMLFSSPAQLFEITHPNVIPMLSCPWCVTTPTPTPMVVILF